MTNISSSSVKARLDAITQKLDGTDGSEKAKKPKRKDKIKALEQIANVAKDVMGAINSQDEALIEIEDNFDDLSSEVDDLAEQLEALDKQSKEQEDGIESTNKRIAELEKKAEKEPLTEEEQEELSSYYLEYTNKKSELDGTDRNTKNLNSKLSNSTKKFESYNHTLTQMSQSMSEYAEAGKIIQEAAAKYGRKDAAKNTDKILNRSSSKTNDYVASKGLTEVGDNGSTYYDSANGDYSAKYDVKQHKILGKKRDLTVNINSYGAAITAASNDLGKRVLDVGNEVGQEAEKNEPKKAPGESA